MNRLIEHKRQAHCKIKFQHLHLQKKLSQTTKNCSRVHQNTHHSSKTQKNILSWDNSHLTMQKEKIHNTVSESEIDLQFSTQQTYQEKERRTHTTMNRIEVAYGQVMQSTKMKNTRTSLSERTIFPSKCSPKTI